MTERATPPEDITPETFFSCWVPEAVASDPQRRVAFEQALWQETVELLRAVPTVAPSRL